MMSKDRSQRISMDEAHRRFAGLELSENILYHHIDTRHIGYFTKAPESIEDTESLRKHCSTVCNPVA